MKTFLALLLLLLSVGYSAAQSPVTYVQQAAGRSSATTAAFSVSFPLATKAGDLIIAGTDFAAASNLISITDTQGNYFFQPGPVLVSPGKTQSAVRAARNIKGGVDTITVTLSAASAWIELYLVEYSGADITTPIDVQIGAAGPAGNASSGSAAVNFPNERIFGFCVGDSACTTGVGFTARSTFNNNLVEDMPAGAAGPYAATGKANNGWTMQMFGIKPATAVAPIVTFSPSSLAFPVQAPNTVRPPQLVTMSNTGTGPLTITGITMGGLNGGEFSQTNTCGTSLAPGKSCTISVVFAPLAARTATLSFTDNASGSPQNVNLSGTVGGGSVTHTVNLVWTNSLTPGVSGYNVLKSLVSGGPYTQLNNTPVNQQPFIDVAVTPGSLNCYVMTSINLGISSNYSNESCAKIPTP